MIILRKVNKKGYSLQELTYLGISGGSGIGVIVAVVIVVVVVVVIVVVMFMDPAPGFMYLDYQQYNSENRGKLHRETSKPTF